MKMIWAVVRSDEGDGVLSLIDLDRVVLLRTNKVIK